MSQQLECTLLLQMGVQFPVPMGTWAGVLTTDCNSNYMESWYPTLELPGNLHYVRIPPPAPHIYIYTM